VLPGDEKFRPRMEPQQRQNYISEKNLESLARALSQK